MVARAITKKQSQGLEAELDALAQRFANAESALAAKDLSAVAEIRDAMSTAGRILIRLVHRDLIEPPTPPPPWLAWSLRRFGRRPSFDGGLLFGVTGRGSPPRSLRDMCELLAVTRRRLDRETPSRDREFHPTILRYRHVFLEAIAGWLGRQLVRHSLVDTPVATLFIHQDQEPTGDEPTASIALDWTTTPIVEQHLLFLDIARAGSRVCQHLAGVLLGASSPVPTTPNPPCVEERLSVMDLPSGTSIAQASPPTKASTQFAGTSEASVTAIVRAADALSREFPDTAPNKKQIKTKAKKTGGAGDLALKRAIELQLISPDLRLTGGGSQFLKDRS